MTSDVRRFLAATLLAVGVGSGTCHPAHADDPVPHARMDRTAVRFEVHPDLTYVQTIEVDATLNTQRGIAARERSAISFYPNSQDLDVLEAWVTEPDGTRVPVTAAQMFTRPSAASEDAPGFVGSSTTTVVYPRLREGSRTHVKWRLLQKTPPMLGFNVWQEPPLEFPTTLASVDVEAPEALSLHWTERGGFATTETVDAGVRRIHSEIRQTRGIEPERNMVASSDFQPLFLLTSLPSTATLGAIYHRAERDKLAVTPAISALAAQVVGTRDGLDAARALYDWVAQNIRYVAVYLDPNDGWVPHPADTVLRNGYGDCKDHVALYQALLASRGIRAEAAIVDWSSRTRDLPLWHPGAFNHVIAYLPDFDVFANPTNAYATFDARDPRLAGKPVVIATETGAVARTPALRLADNRYRIDSEITLTSDGTIEGRAHIATAAGLDGSLRSAVVAAASPRQITDRLLGNTPEGGFGSLLTSDPRDLDQRFAVSATWTSPHGVTFQGSRAFMPVPTGPDLRPPHFLRQYLSGGDSRRTPILIGAGEFLWNFDIVAPAGIEIAAIPADFVLTNAAGSYAANYRRTDTGLHVARRLVLLRDVTEPADYAELQELLYAPAADARAVITLERADGIAPGGRVMAAQ